MPDNIRMAAEGTTFSDGTINVSWGIGGDPEVVAAPPASRSARLVAAIQAGAVVETTDDVTELPAAAPAVTYVRMVGTPAAGEVPVWNDAEGVFEPGTAGADEAAVQALIDASLESSTPSAPGIGPKNTSNAFTAGLSSTANLSVAFTPTAGRTVLMMVGAVGRGVNSITQTGVTWSRLTHRSAHTYNYCEIWKGRATGTPSGNATVALTGANWVGAVGWEFQASDFTLVSGEVGASNTAIASISTSYKPVTSGNILFGAFMQQNGSVSGFPYFSAGSVRGIYTAQAGSGGFGACFAATPDATSVTLAVSGGYTSNTGNELLLGELSWTP